MIDKKLVIAIMVIVITFTITAFSMQFLINKYLNVMLLSKLVPFILESEGGLSRDPFDKEAARPAPWEHEGQTGWHTNKGVTYTTFVTNASRLGYAATSDNFFKMPDDIFLKILKGGYMASYPLDKINHLPRIQAVIITWAWGSGVSGSERYLADFQREVMGIQDSNITKQEIVENFRKKVNPINEKEWFDKLCDRRALDFSKMSTYSQHGKGWMNRLNKFRKLFA